MTLIVREYIIYYLYHFLRVIMIIIDFLLIFEGFLPLRAPLTLKIVPSRPPRAPLTLFARPYIKIWTV